MIQDSFQENAGKQSVSDYNSVNVYSLLEYHNNYAGFETMIENCVSLNISFWTELLEKNIDINKLHNFGNQIMNSMEKISEVFKRLNDIDGNHIKCLNTYAHFLKDVRNDEDGALTLFERFFLFNLCK
jgi:hypothetical protein